MPKVVTPFLKNHVVFSSIDHPGILSTLYYTNPLVCNMYCFYCHNKNEYISLLKSGDKSALDFLLLEEFFDSVKFYKMLGSELVIFSGGEPLFNRKFLNFIKKYRKYIDLPVRIDTNGMNPDVMEELSGLVDGYAIRIKVKDIYNDKDEEQISYVRDKLGVKNPVEYFVKVRRSIELSAGLPFTIIGSDAYLS